MRYRIQTKKKSTEKPAQVSSSIVSRPFAQSTTASPALQTKQENKENTGHNFANIPVLNHQTETKNSTQPTLQLKGGANKEKSQQNEPVKNDEPQELLEINPQIKVVKKTDKECEQIIKKNGCSWTEIKTNFKDDETTMWNLWAYRKRYVDQLINQLREKYPGLIAKSVGSQDRESDYDLTISSPGTDNDVKAVAEFNKIIKAKFGKQPGTVFDTNLYAKDYLKVDETIDDKAKQKTQGTDKDLDQPDQNFSQTGSLDQDVAALVKQRRYMNPAEWENYTQSVVSQIGDPKEQGAIFKQYEEADAIIQIAASQLLKKAKSHVKTYRLKLKHTPEFQKKDQQALKAIPNMAVRKMVEKQLLQIEELHVISHEYPDVVLEKSNDLYVERMAKVRTIQKQIKGLEKSENPKAEKESDQINVLKAEVKKLLGEACFFASEAYHSEGAVKHVVAGLQGENSAEALKKLTPIDILQSFNEQLGDFLKDIVHYTQEKAPPGKTFYRSSKYLYRLFDAVKELKKRDQFKDMKLEIEKTQTVDEFATKVKSELLAVRKGDKKFDDEDKKLAHCEEVVDDLFKVKTAEGLKQVVLKMSADFNQKVRNQLSFKLDEKESKKYFQHRK